MKLLYRRTRCGAPRRPTRRAARRAVPVAQRAYRHREQRGVDSGENQVFRQNINFEILQISKLICSRSRPAGFPAWPVQGKVKKEGMDEAEGWFGNSRSLGVLQARQHRADKRSPPCAESGEGGFRAIFGSGLLSHMTLCSIIGEEELNYRVRNGIGCTLFSMAAKKFGKI